MYSTIYPVVDFVFWCSQACKYYQTEVKNIKVCSWGTRYLWLIPYKRCTNTSCVCSLRSECVQFTYSRIFRARARLSAFLAPIFLRPNTRHPKKIVTENDRYLVTNQVGNYIYRIIYVEVWSSIAPRAQEATGSNPTGRSKNLCLSSSSRYLTLYLEENHFIW